MAGTDCTPAAQEKTDPVEREGSMFNDQEEEIVNEPVEGTGDMEQKYGMIAPQKPEKECIERASEEPPSEAIAPSHPAGRQGRKHRNVRAGTELPKDPTNSPVLERNNQWRKSGLKIESLGLGKLTAEPEPKAQLEQASDFLYCFDAQAHEFDPEAHHQIAKWVGKLFGEATLPQELLKLIFNIGAWILYCGMGVEGLLTFAIQIATEYEAFTDSGISLPGFEAIYKILEESDESGVTLFASRLQEIIKSRLLTYYQSPESQDKPFYFQLGIELKHDLHRDVAARMGQVRLDAGDKTPAEKDMSQDYTPPPFGMILSRVFAGMLVARGGSLGLGSAVEIRTCSLGGEVDCTCPSPTNNARVPMGCVDIFCCSERNAQQDAFAPPADSNSFGFLWARVESTVVRMEKLMEISTTYDSVPIREGFPQTDLIPAFFRPEMRKVKCERKIVVGTDEDPKTIVSKIVQSVCKDSNRVNYDTRPRRLPNRDRKERPMYECRLCFKQDNGKLITIDPWEMDPTRECSSKREAEHVAATAFLQWFKSQPQYQSKAQETSIQRLVKLLTGEDKRLWEFEMTNNHEIGPEGGYHTTLILWSGRDPLMGKRKELLKVDTRDMLEGRCYSDLKVAQERAIAAMIQEVTRVYGKHRSTPKPLATQSEPDRLRESNQLIKPDYSSADLNVTGPVRNGGATKPFQKYPTGPLYTGAAKPHSSGPSSSIMFKQNQSKLAQSNKGGDTETLAQTRVETEVFSRGAYEAAKSTSAPPVTLSDVGKAAPDTTSSLVPVDKLARMNFQGALMDTVAPPDLPKKNSNSSWGLPWRTGP